MKLEKKDSFNLDDIDIDLRVVYIKCISSFFEGMYKIGRAHV